MPGLASLAAAVVALAAPVAVAAIPLVAPGAAPAAPARQPTTTWTTANRVAAGDQNRPSVAANRDGRVAVAWQDDRDALTRDGSVRAEVFLRVFDAGAPVYERRLSTGGAPARAWRHVTPDVALDDAGTAVVVWAEDGDGNGMFNVQYRVVAPDGRVVGGGRVNDASAGDQLLPRVAADPDGAAPGGATAFTVVWEDVQGGERYRVKAAGYTSPEAKAYEVFVGRGSGVRHRPDVAVGASGDAVVVWEEDARGGGSYDVALTGLDRADGDVTLRRRTANERTEGQQREPVVVAGYGGDFAVAWEADDTVAEGVWARSFASDGTPRHGGVRASGPVPASDPAVGIDDQGGVVVGWTATGDDPDVWVRGLGPDGAAAGRRGTAPVSRTTAGRQRQLALAVSPWGELAAAYADDSDRNTYEQVEVSVSRATSTTW
jgi:hypothetical protein